MPFNWTTRVPAISCSSNFLGQSRKIKGSLLLVRHRTLSDQVSFSPVQAERIANSSYNVILAENGHKLNDNCFWLR